MVALFSLNINDPVAGKFDKIIVPVGVAQVGLTVVVATGVAGKPVKETVTLPVIVAEQLPALVLVAITVYVPTVVCRPKDIAALVPATGAPVFTAPT
jgi:hypothetical protein